MSFNQVEAQLLSCVPPRSAKSVFSGNRMKNKGGKTSPDNFLGRQEQKTKNLGCIDFSCIYLTSKTPKKWGPNEKKVVLRYY